MPNTGVLQERVLSIHEASCVLISYLCELSSKARQQISHSEGVIESLVGKVLLMSDAEIIHNAASAHSAIGGGAATFGADSSSLAAAGTVLPTALRKNPLKTLNFSILYMSIFTGHRWKKYIE